MTWKPHEVKPHYEDEWGNIWQFRGGVIPVKCQVCNVAFNSPQQVTEIKQQFPIYKCKGCVFESTSADYAWDHEKANLNHIVEKTVSHKVVDRQVILTGKLANIVHTKNGPIITCNDCKGK